MWICCRYSYATNESNGTINHNKSNSVQFFIIIYSEKFNRIIPCASTCCAPQTGLCCRIKAYQIHSITYSISTKLKFCIYPNGYILFTVRLLSTQRSIYIHFTITQKKNKNKYFHSTWTVNSKNSAINQLHQKFKNLHHPQIN